MTNKREDILNKVPVWNPITKIGIGMLITSFIILPAGILACWFVFSETRDYYPFIIISLMILFFLCMISVGGYLTGKGITMTSEIAKGKQELEIVKIKQEEKKQSKNNKGQEEISMDIDKRLMKEYEIAWGIINRLGNATIVIKGWCVTLVAAILGFSISKDMFDNRILILLSILILSFWFIEATYRRVMETFKTRCKEIEGYFEDMKNKRNIASPLLAKSIEREREIISLIKAALLIRVFPLYLFLFIGITLISLIGTV